MTGPFSTDCDLKDTWAKIETVPKGISVHNLQNKNYEVIASSFWDDFYYSIAPGSPDRLVDALAGPSPSR